MSPEQRTGVERRRRLIENIGRWFLILSFPTGCVLFVLLRQVF